MAQLKFSELLFVVALFTSCVLAQDRVPINSCSGVTGQLLDVRVSNCASGFPCILRKGSPAIIEFDYIPSAPSTRVTTGATGRIGGVPLPFIGTNNTPACSKIVSKQSRQAVGCNLNPGEVYTYSNTFPILQIYPSTMVNVQWELVDSTTRQKIVCFNIPARIL